MYDKKLTDGAVLLPSRILLSYNFDKLTHWDFKNPITFEIKGIKHTIEVEHKFNHVKEVEKKEIKNEKD